MQTGTRSICVLKLGGSLFDLPDLIERLDHLLQTDVRGRNVCLIPGGGGFADEVRRLDSVHRWPVECSHRLAIQTMGLTARMLAAMGTRFQLIDRLNFAREAEYSVLDVSQFPELRELPASWDITSDSIAAWVANHLQASQLILLKSISIGDPLPSVEAAIEAGWVDAGFQHAARALPLVSWANLRSSLPTTSAWLRYGRILSEE